MPTSETDIDYAAELRSQQAQAMLDLFEADRQRGPLRSRSLENGRTLKTRTTYHSG